MQHQHHIEKVKEKGRTICSYRIYFLSEAPICDARCNVASKHELIRLADIKFRFTANAQIQDKNFAEVNGCPCEKGPYSCAACGNPFINIPLAVGTLSNGNNEEATGGLTTHSSK